MSGGLLRLAHRAGRYPAEAHHLLRTVIFISGFLSAFFVNDIICLVMVPFVLKVSDRMGVKSIPYLLAVATASNIGSTATITGNPQTS